RSRPGFKEGRKLKAATSACQRLRCGALKATTSPVLSRRPQYVFGSLVVGIAAGDEQIIRQSVDVLERRLRHVLPGLIFERHHDAFRAPADGAGEMQISRSRRATGQDERFE